MNRADADWEHHDDVSVLFTLEAFESRAPVIRRIVFVVVTTARSAIANGDGCMSVDLTESRRRSLPRQDDAGVL